MEAANAGMAQDPIAGRAADLHRRAIVVNNLALARDINTLTGAQSSGGVTAVNWTISAPGGGYLPNDLAGITRRLAQVHSAIRFENADANLIRSVDGIHRCKSEGRPGIILGFQDSLAIEDSLDNLTLFYLLGVRIIQLTYQRGNLVGDGNGEDRDAGLSLFGKAMVRRMNELGILIDLSHVGARTTDEAIELSEVPCAFTHANLYHHRPHSRNKTDEAIKKLTSKGGVMGITAISRYLSPEGNARGTTIEDIVDQIEYVSDLVGVDHVGIGLDISEDMTKDEFDRRMNSGLLSRLPELQAGAPPTFEHYYPNSFRTMANLGLLTEALCRRQFTDEHILKILGGNWLRLFGEVWKPQP